MSAVEGNGGASSAATAMGDNGPEPASDNGSSTGFSAVRTPDEGKPPLGKDTSAEDGASCEKAEDVEKTTDDEVSDSDDDNGEDGEAEDEEDGDEDGADEDVEERSASGLLDEGRMLFRLKKFPDAASILSRAVEKRVSELGGEETSDSDLAEYYLWYGDALLSIEEMKSNLFDFVKTGSNAPSSTQPASSDAVSADVVTDEQLAFEILEMARRSYAMKLKLNSNVTAAELLTSHSKVSVAPLPSSSSPQRAASSSTEAPRDSGMAVVKAGSESIDKSLMQDILDYSYVFIRLADIYLCAEFYDDAAEEYLKAVNLRRAFCFEAHQLFCPLLSHAQALFFGGQKSKALEIFESCESMAERMRRGEESSADNMSEETLQDTLDDISIQIAEIKKSISEDVGNPSAAIEKGSQTRVKEHMVQTTSTFDKPQLDSSSRITRIKCSAPPIDNPDASTLKKRRIDLTRCLVSNSVVKETTTNDSNSISHPNESITNPENMTG